MKKRQSKKNMKANGSWIRFRLTNKKLLMKYMKRTLSAINKEKLQNEDLMLLNVMADHNSNLVETALNLYSESEINLHWKFL